MKIIYSPHLDDAILSLGGTIKKWIDQQNKVLVIDIFSLSDYIRGKKLDWKEATKIRKYEEQKTAKILGYKLKFLDKLESGLRGYKRVCDHYPKKINWKKDQKVFKSLVEIFKNQLKRRDEYYFPLAIGENVDHLLVREAAIKAITSGLKKKKIFFYEDLPYVYSHLLNQKIIRRLKLTPILTKINIRKKLSLVKIFKSQIKKANDNSDWCYRIKEYAAKLKRKGFYERSWRLL